MGAKSTLCSMCVISNDISGTALAHNLKLTSFFAGLSI